MSARQHLLLVVSPLGDARSRTRADPNKLGWIGHYRVDKNKTACDNLTTADDATQAVTQNLTWREKFGPSVLAASCSRFISEFCANSCEKLVVRKMGGGLNGLAEDLPLRASAEFDSEYPHSVSIGIDGTDPLSEGTIPCMYLYR